MKILQVIHGYPMHYNAGSEVYTQTLSRELSKGHDVRVFTREENPFAPDYTLRESCDDSVESLKLDIINLPRTKDRYIHKDVDIAFRSVLDQYKPDVVHIGHLNHLSVSLVKEIKKKNIPVVYTLHDYWVMCPRGQFMQMHPEDPADLWPACDGQEDEKCAKRCYARYFGGDGSEEKLDIDYWKNWVNRRMSHLREMASLVDQFIAPSRFLMDLYIKDFGLAEEKIEYLDYGFDQSRMDKRVRSEGQPFTFGYIGTHIPAKGIHHLVEAFSLMKEEAILKIFGRERDQNTSGLRRLVENLPVEFQKRIHWESEYKNENIVQDVFNHIDSIVVPSIWWENSPLVIHEAQEAGLPVITANVGGMSEYVHHEVNGLLFSHRDPEAMAIQMDRLAGDLEFARRLGQKGYPFSSDGRIPDIQTHGKMIVKIYEKLIGGQGS